MSRKGADPIYLGLILFLFGYVFFADFLISVFGLTFIKGLCAIGTLLFGGAYCVVNFSRLRLNQYLFIPIIVLFVYVFVFHSTHALSYFYTAILAFLLIQNQKKGRTRIFPWQVHTDPHDSINKGFIAPVRDKIRTKRVDWCPQYNTPE